MFANEWTFNGNNGNNYFGLFRSWGLGIHRITSTPGNDLVLPGSVSMLGHTGEAYGLVSDAFFDTIRKVGFVFMNNGVGIGYQTNNNSAYYTIEQEVFAAIENHGNIMDCQLTSGLHPIKEVFNMIYPNPTEGHVKIEIQNQLIKHVEIYNVIGKLIKESSENHFDLFNYKNGIYLIKVQTDKGFYISKLLKL
jgi:hypothetical protein